MSIDTFIPDLHLLGQHTFGLWAVIFCITFAESLVFLGWLLPGTIMLASLGLMLGKQELALLPAWIAAWLGTLSGHTLSFILGALMPSSWLKIYPLSHHPEWLNRTQNYFQQHGGKSVFFGRFIAPIRPFLPIAAGLSGMRLPYFMAIDAMAGALWISLYLLPAAGIGHTWQYWLSAKDSSLLIICVAIASGIAILGWYYRDMVRALMQKLQISTPTRLLTLAALCAAALLILCLTLNTPWIKNIDQWLWQQCQQSSRDHTWLHWFSFFAAKENLFFCYALVCAVLFYQKSYKALFIWGATGIGTALTIGLTKYLFAQPRPITTTSYLELHAFPSGHMALSCQFWLSLLGLLPNQNTHRKFYILTLGLWLGIVAVNRLCLGAHWLSDLVGGLLLGGMVGLFTLAMLRSHHQTKQWSLLKAVCIVWLSCGIIFSAYSIVGVYFSNI